MKLARTRFFDYVIEANGPHDRSCDAWLFYPGMLFNNTRTWWGNGGDRSRAHEGIDVCFYRDTAGHVQQLTTSTRIPVMYAGEVVQITDDYLGSSIFVGHELEDGNGNRFHTIYSHVDTLQSLRIGSLIANHEIMATVSDARKKNTDMPPHLHLTLAWIPEGQHPARLNWKTLQTCNAILIDPLTCIECTYAILPHRQGKGAREDVFQ